MLKEFVDRLLALAQVETIDRGDHLLATKPMHLVEYPCPKPLELGSLTGLVDYVRENTGQRDMLTAQSIMCHVVDEGRVEVRFALIAGTMQRRCFAVAKFDHERISFGTWMPREDFMVMLMSRFVPTDDSARLLAVLGNMTESAIRTSEDDGVTQRLTVKTGIARVGETAITNPVVLAPYRAFAEIEQPASNFVFRVRQGKEGDLPQVALFEADGGAWRNAARRGIAAWLADRLAPLGVTVIA